MIEKEFNKVKLFSGVIYRKTEDYNKVKKLLEKDFSKVDYESDEIPFVFTNYYNNEMGTPLYRKFLSFYKKIQPEKLSGIKILTNSIETSMMIDGNRVVNIDPGYISDANVIIATAKNHYHRVPLYNGIYAHIEYVIKNKKFHFLEWTYPDFKTEEYLVFFRKLKELYKARM